MNQQIKMQIFLLSLISQIHVVLQIIISTKNWISMMQSKLLIIFWKQTQKLMSFLTSIINLSNIKNRLKNLYYLFRDDTNYALTQWLFNINNTKNDVNAFFDNYWFKFLWKFVNFKNDVNWMNILNDMQYDISNDQ